MTYLAAFFASFFFAILYNVRGRLLIYSSVCGMIGKIIFDLLVDYGCLRGNLRACLQGTGDGHYHCGYFTDCSRGWGV